jgi:hypothetical protein
MRYVINPLVTIHALPTEEIAMFSMFKRPSRKKRIGIAVAAASVVVVGSAGAAFAYWTSTGNGTGSATNGSAANFTITSSAATGGALAPAGPTDTVAFTVTNPGSGTQHLTAVTAGVFASDGTAWTAVTGCSAADYTVGTPVITAGDISAGGTLSGTVTITMVNRAANQNACQGVSVPLYFAAS